MRKIKILHLIKSLGRGGAEMLLPETLALHDKNKIEFHYIYFLPWKNQMVSAIEEQGGIVTCLDARNNFQLISRSRQVEIYIRQNQIDLVHCHLPWAGFVGRLIRKRLSVPVLYTEHNIQERYNRITFWINRWSFNRQDLAIAVSEDVHFSMQTNIHVKVPVKVITNGVNTSKFIRNQEAGLKIKRRYQIPDDAIVIGIVSVFRFQKRLKEWLEVFAAVHKKYPSVYAIIVGDGPLKNEVKAHKKKLGLLDNVVMPGLQADSLPWFSAIDIFMMTSEFEGLPVALLEAMSMECAVVTTDAGGIKEVIRNNVDGLMEPVSNWNKLAEHLDRLVTDAESRQRLGKAARLRVEKSFSLRKMVGELEKVYDSFVSETVTSS